jgi:hypothetical protein
MRLAWAVPVVLLSACGQMQMTVDAGCAVPVLTPPNLARNGLFECGDAKAEFSSLNTSATVEVTPGRSGNGLKLTTSAGLYGNNFGSAWKVTATAPATYCLVTWLKSTSAATTVRLLKYNPSSGNGQNLDFTMPGPLTSWTKVPPNVKHFAQLTAGDELSVVISDKNAGAGTVIEVDDLDLWVSADGRCEESRTP